MRAQPSNAAAHTILLDAGIVSATALGKSRSFFVVSLKFFCEATDVMYLRSAVIVAVCAVLRTAVAQQSDCSHDSVRAACASRLRSASRSHRRTIAQRSHTAACSRLQRPPFVATAHPARVQGVGVSFDLSPLASQSGYKMIDANNRSDPNGPQSGVTAQWQFAFSVCNGETLRRV